MTLDVLGTPKSQKQAKRNNSLMWGVGYGAMTPGEVKTPKVPTIDEARQQRQETDRIRRRRGVLGNIYAGEKAAAPTLGVRTTLGS